MVGEAILSKEPLNRKTRITAKTLFTLVFLIANTFAWYSYAFNVLSEIIANTNLVYSETLTVWIIHFGGVAISALVGAVLLNTIRRIRFILLWMLFGLFSSLLPIIVGFETPLTITLIALCWAISFGLGMPACMAYFTDLTTTENRGKSGGVTFFAIGASMFLLGMINVYGFIAEILTLTAWKGLGLIVFAFLKEGNEREKAIRVPSYSSIVHERPFLLYITGWIMFCLVNYTSFPIMENFFGEEFVYLSSLIEGIVSGIFALISGFLSDIVGRKRLIISGFVMLGIGYATLGVFPGTLFSWYFYTIVDGIAWGMFGPIFILILWGDLSYGMPSEKYYALGGLPLLFANFLQLAGESYLIRFVSVAAAFSLASFFLFLAVVPLMYAPETLPEKKIKERELKQYIEKAKKIKEKHD